MTVADNSDGDDNTNMLYSLSGAVVEVFQDIKVNTIAVVALTSVAPFTNMV